MFNWLRRSKKSESKQLEKPSCMVFRGEDENADDIIIGRQSLSDGEIYPVYRFEGIKDPSCLSEFLQTLTTNTMDMYYIQCKLENDETMWVQIAAPIPKDIEKLNNTASLLDIIDKINEIIDYLNIHRNKV